MESNFKKTVESLFNGMENFVSTKTVVGEAINIGNTIILPLVDVSFGVGAGASEEAKEKTKGVGGGALGAKISPSAVLVIQDGQTKLVNVKNQDSLTKIIDMVPNIMDKFTAKKKDNVKEEKITKEKYPEDEE
ncbi:GerW family sporulation protein [Vallitalea sp.]|jgi:uncharacterized spore protein YtfJ|uniref:GerW family sporulation protein n=1 Tax=Vallitalea sp. TaxID=1882829 RepID=UPI0025DE83A5|nr:GerW family sporulation protein [Vallitalea sp.]MCT4688161.1 GerW family sporulation protein [Vallitalea sp.]